MEEMPNRQWFTVTDLKQHEYCPRIVYYTYCLPLIRPTTFKMEAGAQAHDAAPDLERRRSLKAYRLQDGEREFDVWLESVELGLRGRVDMVITRLGGSGMAGEIIPVEYKDSPGRGGPGWTLQLAAYGVMLESTRGAQRAVSRGFVYYIPQRRAREFALSPELKAQVAVTLQAMPSCAAASAAPPAVEGAGRRHPSGHAGHDRVRANAGASESTRQVRRVRVSPVL